MVGQQRPQRKPPNYKIIGIYYSVKNAPSFFKVSSKTCLVSGNDIPEQFPRVKFLDRCFFSYISVILHFELPINFYLC